MQQAQTNLDTDSDLAQLKIDLATKQNDLTQWPEYASLQQAIDDANTAYNDKALELQLSTLESAYN